MRLARFWAAASLVASYDNAELVALGVGDFLATTGLLGAIVFEPADPLVGRLWSEAASWPIVYDQDGDTAIRAPDGRGPFVTLGPPTGAVKAPDTTRLTSFVTTCPGRPAVAAHAVRSALLTA